MISPISFSGVQGSNFSDLVSKPQAYIRPQTPAAASTLKEEKGKKGGLKKVGIAVVVVAAALAALGFGAKKGIFTSDKIKNETLKKGLSYLNKAGNWIADKAIQLKDKVTGLFKKETAVAEDIAEQAADDIPDEVLDNIIKNVQDALNGNV